MLHFAVEGYKWASERDRRPKSLVWVWANLSSSRDSPGALVGQSPTATRPEKSPLPFIRQGRDGEQYIERGGKSCCLNECRATATSSLNECISLIHSRPMTETPPAPWTKASRYQNIMIAGAKNYYHFLSESVLTWTLIWKIRNTIYLREVA